MKEPKRYIVCKTCAYALVYADTSGMDDDVLDDFESFCNRIGIVVLVSGNAGQGNFDCPGCGEIVYESGHVMEQVI